MPALIPVDYNPFTASAANIAAPMPQGGATTDDWLTWLGLKAQQAPAAIGNYLRNVLTGEYLRQGLNDIAQADAASRAAWERGDIRGAIDATLQNPIIGWLAPGTIGPNRLAISPAPENPLLAGGDVVKNKLAQADALRIENQGLTPGLPMESGSFFSNRVAQPIRAYHGSPYDFEQFDLSKIGTGEGAQAYGHGLYFAENEHVARSYRSALSKMPYGTYDGIEIVGHPGLSLDQQRAALDVSSYMKQMNATPQQSLDYWIRRIKSNGGNASVYEGLKPESFQNVTPGKMYEVNLHADPDTFLHWDKPLSEQPEPVKQALEALLPQNDKPMSSKDLLKNFLTSSYAQQFPEAGDVRVARRIWEDPYYPEEIDEWAAKQEQKKGAAFNLFGTVGSVPQTTTGGQVYQRIASLVGEPGKAPDVAALETLRNAGISGIKYLDQGSRTTGEGTHNYVVFSPEIIKIVRKYGLAPLVAGGATAIAGNSQAATHLVPVDYDPEFVEQLSPADRYPYQSDEYIEPPPLAR